MRNSKEYFEGVGHRDFVVDIIIAVNEYFELPNEFVTMTNDWN
jgi:hypothetical protein